MWTLLKWFFNVDILYNMIWYNPGKISISRRCHLFNPIIWLNRRYWGLIPRGKSDAEKIRSLPRGWYDHQPQKTTIKMVTFPPVIFSKNAHPKCLVNDTDTPSKKNIHVDGKKSCTTWGCIKSWQIMEITSPSTGAGCLPSTVAPETMAFQKQRIVVRPRSFRCLC